ncbi:MAG: hypothetical protein UW05_C0032G0013, partial [Candidatus Giovannonibacteria bacterium GW2011_GWC2_43_8]
KMLKEKYGTLTILINQSSSHEELGKRLLEFKGVGPKMAKKLARILFKDASSRRLEIIKTKDSEKIVALIIETAITISKMPKPFMMLFYHKLLRVACAQNRYDAEGAASAF